jgi:hypothetical protein
MRPASIIAIRQAVEHANSDAERRGTPLPTPSGSDTSTTQQMAVLRELLLNEDEGRVVILNDLIRDKGLTLALQSDPEGLHLAIVDPRASRQLTWHTLIVTALSEMLLEGSTHRLRGCDAPDCAGIVFDESRNGSRRFCGTRCGSRQWTAAYRQRRNKADTDQHDGDRLHDG